MAEPRKEIVDLADAVKEVLKKTHASTVLTVVSRLEESLARIIQGNMPNLTGNKKSELFEGYGPLSSFASKIEIAYAFGLVLADERRNLHAVKSVRNAFAHSTDWNMDFDHPSLEKPLAMLPPPKKAKTPNRDHFLEVCAMCTAGLNKHLENVILVHALRASVESKKASPGK